MRVKAALSAVVVACPPFCFGVCWWVESHSDKQAIQLLRAHGWDVERATDDFFSSGMVPEARCAGAHRCPP